MLSALKNIVFILIFSVSIALTGYAVINYLLNRDNAKKEERSKTQEPENIIVDSLLVVVDSLQVQVDSLHRAGNKVNLVFMPQDIDTSAIIRQYFTKKHHTVKHRGKDLDFKLDFDLLKNKIEAPKLEYKILRPKTEIYKPGTLNTKHLFAGATLGGSIYELDQFTPELVYFSGKHSFKIGYNVLSNYRNLQIGYYFKIK